ncbi:hypothetical protein [Actinomadura parmotrematis]|uniref:TerB family tellurite resistance protein n=1 Tax=Actinomadura parmotrematis TaxID=2864039 RepID=A0ABS7FQ63_9ACTN|nr:hypothetical protein [Actinomadura parmotrematis]MBW8482524.1 hypothetical protein [Actinomadura parmotrematis]
MDARPLVRAIVGALLLLENSPSDELDPDVAVRGMEHIAQELLQLSIEDRREFSALLEEEAVRSEDPHYAEFLRALPFMVGMAE